MRMKYDFTIISDTHNNHDGIRNKFNLPPADFLIHCGDISGRGDEYSLRKFLIWFSSLKGYSYKIFIAGNHDFIFEDYPMLAKEILGEYENIVYLQDSGIDIWGLKFWGTPVSINFNGWAFNRSEEKLSQHWDAIPDDTDILITHSPPYSIMDLTVGSKENVGSPSLYKRICEIKPKISAFGHIHEGYGIKEIGETKFINASVLDERYRMVNKPIKIEIEK